MGRLKKVSEGAFSGAGKVRFNTVRDDLMTEIVDVLGSFRGGASKKLVSGAITITGHSYWVVLEYGSSPETPNPGPKKGDPILLSLPKNLPRPKNHRQWYRIAKKNRNVVRAHTMRPMLRFKGADGGWVSAAVVWHPGIAPRGFIRKALLKTQKQFLAGLRKLAEAGFMDRIKAVDLMNDYMRGALRAIQASIPLGDPKKYLVLASDEGHLRDAFNVVLAR